MNRFFLLFPSVIRSSKDRASRRFHDAVPEARYHCGGRVLFRPHSTHLPHAFIPHEASGDKKTQQRVFNVVFSKPVGKATQMTGGGTREKPSPDIMN